MAPKLTPSQQFHLRNACSDAADKAFHAHWGHPPGGITLLGFTNHYDAKSNRCYLMVTYREGKSTWFDVSDTRTGKTRAHIRIDSGDRMIRELKSGKYRLHAHQISLCASRHACPIIAMAGRAPE